MLISPAGDSAVNSSTRTTDLHHPPFSCDSGKGLLCHHWAQDPPAGFPHPLAHSSLSQWTFIIIHTSAPSSFQACHCCFSLLFTARLPGGIACTSSLSCLSQWLCLGSAPLQLFSQRNQWSPWCEVQHAFAVSNFIWPVFSTWNCGSLLKHSFPLYFLNSTI